MTEELTKKIIAWATEIASYAAGLPSRQARDAYLAERHRELVTGAMAEGAARRDAVVLADACVEAARAGSWASCWCNAPACRAGGLRAG
jgi:hypothetical protein